MAPKPKSKYVPKVTKRRETDPDKFRPQGIVLNKQNVRDFQQISDQCLTAESLYLRENEFIEFDPYVTLEWLRILDLSMNMISGRVDFLPKLPVLRHLYLTSNRIDSLEGISDLECLETLCLSDNQISSFEGLDALPNLRLISMNYNQISSFHMFPHLPALHTLNLVGNPLVQIPSYRGMAIALSAPGLAWIDGKTVEEEERVAVEHHRGKIVFCMAEGFVIEGDNVEEAADKFILDFQRKINDTKPLKLQSFRLASANVDSNLLTEGIAVKMDLCMQDDRPYGERISDVFLSRYFFPVIFKVAGEATEAFLVGSMNQWTNPIPLERCDVDGEAFFHTTLYLPAGDYEYRYIVDGKESVSDEHKITSKFKQGECNLYHVTEPDQQDDNDTQSLFYIRWMRSDVNNGFSVIPDENSLTYVPTGDDIGFCLRAEVLVYINGDFSFQYFDISTPVSAGPPLCSKLGIIGDASEGSALTVNALYSGGAEGNSGLSWFRVTPDGDEVPIEMEDPWVGYELGLEDISHRIKVEYTPIRNDWVAGAPMSTMTSIVAAGVPTCRDIKIVGEPLQEQPLSAETLYSGGVEGESVFQWFRHDEANDEFFPVSGEDTAFFTPTIADVGKIIAVEYTPISRDGIEGEACRCVLDKAVDAADPTFRSVTITGDLEEQSVLVVEYDYFGGYFGNHQIQWNRIDVGNVRKAIGKPNTATLTLTQREVGTVIECQVVPVRSDGMQGERSTAVTTAPVQGGLPHLRTMEVVGEPAPGNVLEAVADYFGGDQGDSQIEWSRGDAECRNFEVVARNTKKYIVQPEDTGSMLRLSYTPVRKDGVIGAMKSRLIEIPGTAPIPAIQDPVPVERVQAVPQASLMEPVVEAKVEPVGGAVAHADPQEGLDTDYAQRESDYAQDKPFADMDAVEETGEGTYTEDPTEDMAHGEF